MNYKDKGASTIPDIFRHTVSQYPERTAIIDGGKYVCYRELLSVEQRLVRHLVEDHRVLAGQKIALFLPNSMEFILSFLAVAEIGGVAVPLNIGLKEHELLYYIDKCDITAVITFRSLLSRWGTIPLQEKVIFIFADTWENSSGHIWSSHISDGLIKISPPRPSDAEVVYLGTSGSTGKPRIVSRTHANVIAGAENVGRALEVTDEDRFLSITPFFHANGFSNCMFLPIMYGATVVLMRQFSPRQALSLLKEKNITVIVGSPFIYSTLADIGDEPLNLPSVRLCLSTGASMPQDLRKSFFEKFGVKLAQLYGSSEAGTISIELEDQTIEGSVGTPLARVQLKIIDDKNLELPPSQIGEIIVRSPAMMQGYVGEPELCMEIFCHGYFRTGDLGMIDGRGTLYLSGRKKKFINASGIKVDPVEIETVLLSFQKIKEARVVGVYNRRGMEILKAVLVAQKDCTLQEVVGYCRNRLADFKVPRIIEFRDRLPQNILGKVPGNELTEAQSLE